MHWWLPINELINQRRWKENGILWSRGGRFSWCQKLEAVCCSSVQCLVTIGEMLLGRKMFPAKKKNGGNKWAGPPNGRVRWVSDLWEWNKVVKRKQYPLPIIWDILQQHKGYKFFTKTSQCNIIPLNLMLSQKIYVLLQHPLVNSNTIDYLWVLNAPLIMLRKSWKISSETLTLRTQSLYWQYDWCLLPFMGWSYGTTAHYTN